MCLKKKVEFKTNPTTAAIGIVKYECNGNSNSNKNNNKKMLYYCKINESFNLKFVVPNLNKTMRLHGVPYSYCYYC